MAIHAAMEGSKDQPNSRHDNKSPLRCPISGRAPETNDKSGSKDKKAGLSTIGEQANDFASDNQDHADRDCIISPRSSSGSLRSQSAPSEIGSHAASRMGSNAGSHMGSIASGIRSNLPPASRLVLSASSQTSTATSGITNRFLRAGSLPRPSPAAGALNMYNDPIRLQRLAV
jgi:hypothetical protein